MARPHEWGEIPSQPLDILGLWTRNRGEGLMAAPPPDGWYKVPADPTQERFWDGTAWTDQYRATPTSVLAAGFYPKPDDPLLLQYWDGSRWAQKFELSDEGKRSVATHNAPKKGMGCFGIALIILLVIVVPASVLIGWYGSTHPATPAAPPAVQQSTTHSVEYTYSGSAIGGSITYTTDDGIEQQDVGLQSKTGFVTDLNFLSVSTSIQNLGDTGTVKCSIRIDGELVSENKSGAAYGIAQCSALIGG